jgi:hypothetical protein
MGFDHIESARAFHFDVLAEGAPKKRCTVTADLRLFLQHRIAIQEGPALSASKLAADMQNQVEGTHELTADDLLAYANRRTADEARRAATRRSRKAEQQELAPDVEPQHMTASV